MQTLQEQYNQIKQGKGNKPHFLKQARHLFPDYLNHYNNYEDTINILKSKSILSENRANLGMVSGSGRKDWFSLFEENINIIGIHWFNGNDKSKDYCNNLNLELLKNNEPTCLIDKFVKQYIQKN